MILSLRNYQARGQNSPFILSVIPVRYLVEHSIPTHLHMEQDCRLSLKLSTCRKNSNTNTSVSCNCLKGSDPNKHSKEFSSSMFLLFPVCTSRNLHCPNKLQLISDEIFVQKTICCSNSINLYSLHGSQIQNSRSELLDMITTFRRTILQVKSCPKYLHRRSLLLGKTI